MQNSADAIAGRAMMNLARIRDAQIFVLTPPAISGLGQSNGFTFELQARGGTDRATLLNLRNQLLGAAAKDPSLSSVRIPVTEMIKETISRLIFMLDGGEFKYQQTFSGELVLRDSVIDGPHR